jgi:hypothetical protein
VRGCGSEHTGPGTEGDMFNPPDEHIFKPFYMKVFPPLRPAAPQKHSPTSTD